MRYSDNIEIFLEFLRQAKREYQIAITEEREKDAASQDLDHCLELNNNSYHDMAKIAKTITQVRRERRQAKDRQQVLKPVTDWMYQNARVIKIWRNYWEQSGERKKLWKEGRIPRKQISSKKFSGRESRERGNQF